MEKAQREQRRQANTQASDEKESEARRDEPPNRKMGRSESRLGFAAMIGMRNKRCPFCEKIS
jgi:hypothetical protein